MAKAKKKTKKAYHRGREEGFDRGLSVAKMIYNDVVVELKIEIEKLNSEIILGDEDDGLCEDDTTGD